MNRGVLQSFPVQQMMGGNLNFWTVNSMRSPSQQSSPLLPPPSIFPQYTPAASSLPSGSCHEIQELPESWNQLLVSGLVGEEERYNFKQLVAKKVGNWDNHVLCPSSLSMVDVKPELHAASTPWGAQNLQPSSPRSCVSTNMLDFSNSVEGKHQKQDNSSECNSTATAVAYKKPRIQPPSQPTFKVRKEKLGDRITALHQLVSPFGKTDTASVLLEAIEYIRFLQSQIEALSSPYLGNGSADMRQTVQGERNCIFPEDPGQDGGDELKKDLRSRGLCLVPVSCTVQVGSNNGADLWAPSLGGGF